MQKNIPQLEKKSANYLQYETEARKITWCGNCGNYGIQNALKRALTLEGLGRRDVLLCYDVGCSGNGSDKIEANTIHGLHGRVISLAAGASIANHNIRVIASAGDGATFSEGVNHLVHGVRNNYRVVFIHHNNENYGLTTGQASALTRKGVKMNATPDGVDVPPINPLDFVLGLNPSFVARSFSGEPDHLTEILRQALNHDGFSFIDVLQACPTYNRATPDHWYSKRIRDLKSLKNYDNQDIWQARKIVQDLEEDIFIGLIYYNPDRKSFIKTQPQRDGIQTTLVEEVFS